MNSQEKIITYIPTNCKRCGYSWHYCGKNKFVCTCPACKTSVVLEPKKKNNSGGSD